MARVSLSALQQLLSPSLTLTPPHLHPTHLTPTPSQVSRIVLQLLTDLGSSSAVKRQFLSGVTSLCIFMMRQV